MPGTINSLKKFLVTDKAVFIQISNQDSLFLHADTISAITIADTSLNGYRLMRALPWLPGVQQGSSGKNVIHSHIHFQDSVIRPL